MKILIIFILTAIFSGCCSSVRYPKHYADYTHNSGFEIDTVDSTMIDNLEVLGMVWGFAKYHHPIFEDTVLSVDYELFELLPRIAEAEKHDRNRILVDWIDGLGHFDYVPAKYARKLNKSDYISVNNDCKWIQDTSILGAELSSKLQTLRFADRKNINNYVRYYTKDCFINFESDSLATSAKNLDMGYRLLSLFRYWNIIEYYFPYRELTDNNWNAVLRKYIPLFCKDGEQSYKYRVAQLIAEINDTHGYNDLDFIFGNRIAPVGASFIEDKLIVTSVNEKYSFQLGDEILSVNERTPDDAVSLTRLYNSCSNSASVLRNAATFIFQTSKPVAEIKYKRNDHQLETLIETIHNISFLNANENNAARKQYFKMLNDSVGYLYPANEIKNSYLLDDLKNKIAKTKIMIIDHRCYPVLTGGKMKHHLFVKEKTHVSDLTLPLISLPGYFKIENTPQPFKNKKAYKGIIVVLVNEQTQSMGEYQTMMLQTRPNTIVIGSQTAGADGNVAHILLPGGIRTMISGLGVFYPDGTPTQRIGVKIDHYVEPTIQGIKQGRDEVLEKALEILGVTL